MGDHETALEQDKGTVARHQHDEMSDTSSTGEMAGVKGVEAITRTWTTWSLVAAYIGIFLIAFSSSLEQQTTVNLTAYATSAFGTHSLIATVYTVQGVVNACIKPVMAKLCNVFGRLEAFSISILLYILGYIQMAGSQNIQTFASAQIFYSAGFTGILITSQIFIADTSDLKWRALFSSLPDTPFLVTVWVGPLIASDLVLTWRWGYGLWTIVLPVAFLPLALALGINSRKAKKMGMNPPRPWEGKSLGQTLKTLWFELDIFGLLLLSAAISLILIPLTLAAGAKGGWSNASIIAMIVVGCLCLVAFPFWESNKKLAPYPFMPLRMFLNRNVAIGCASGFLYFAIFYTSVFPYFISYLQVVQNESIVAAGHVTQTFSFTSTVTSVLIGVVMRFVRHFKYFIIAGAALYFLAIGLLIHYRQENASISSNVGIQILLGIGGGLFNVPMQVAVQAAVPHVDVAAATALYLTLIEIGGAVGSAISGAIWTGNLLPKLNTYLPASAKDQASLIYGNITIAKSFEVGTPERIAINRSYQETMTTILTVSVCLCAPFFLLVLCTRNVNLGTIDQKVRGKVIGQSTSAEDVNGEMPGTETLATDGRTDKKALWKSWRN